MTEQRQPRRILMTADTLGGVWTYAIELARVLGQQGIEVILATMGAPLNYEQREQSRHLRLLTIKESEYRLEWMDEPWADVERAGQWLLGLEQQYQPDVIHLNGFAHGALPWHAPTVVVGHSCVISWWQAVKGEAAPARWDTYRTMVTRGLRAADLVVAPTYAMAASLQANYKLPRAVRVIHNGRSALPLREQPKEPFIFSAGRLWDEAKNLAALQSVAPDLSWPVVVAGSGHHPSGREVVTTNVRCLGNLEPAEIAHWFSRAAIYALPARYEPFGLSALEAALAGCALVLGDLPSLREVWGDAALYVAPGDLDQLRATLRGLIANEWRRQALAQQAHSRARQFSPERMAAGYLDLYDILLAPDLSNWRGLAS